MGQITRLALVPVLLVSACADDEVTPPVIDAAIDAAVVDAPETDASTVDADPDAIPIDAPIDAPSSVMVVTCPGTPDLTIGINGLGDAYDPATATINVNDIVRFDPNGTFHDMDSGTPGSPDGLFDTPLSQVTCLQFTAAGTYPFFCSVHVFTGTITVN